MIATAHCTPVSPASLLTLSQAAECFGVHYQTLRLWHKQGRIKAYRTVGGHRRFCPDSIAKALGIEIEKSSEGDIAKIAIYCRVSSQTQQHEGSLDRQIERLKSVIIEREGVEPVLYRDVASAFGERRGLNQLVEDLIAGKVLRVYVEYSDRLSRVPALTRLLESLCRNRSVEIVALDREEKNPNELQSAMLELVEFTTVISNRINGRKGGRQTQVEVPPEYLKEAYELKKQGLSLREISRRFDAKGYTDQRGKKFERSLLGNRLRDNWQTLDQLYGNDNHTNSFLEFAELYVRQVRSPKATITRAKLADVYSRWCNREGKLEVSDSTITKMAQKLGWKKEIFGSRSVKFVGLSLTTNKGEK